MSYSVNRKFTYLIENVFHRYNNINIKSILDTIQTFKRGHEKKFTPNPDLKNCILEYHL